MSQAKPKKLKLMVVDDEPDNLDLLYRTFRRDFHVVRSDNAISALELLDQEGEMAVIISDQRMPIMNGTEFLSKTVERFPETIRILLTGYTDVEDLVDAINSGQVFKYITKPWNPEHLKSVVQQASETYGILKQRTDQLRRVIRQEELFNKITSAIRESLDYDNMLQTIVQTIGNNFAAQEGIIQAVEDQQLVANSIWYQNHTHNQDKFAHAQDLMEQVIKNGKLQITEHGHAGDRTFQLAIPLIFQKQTLAVLSLHHISEENPWTESDRKLLQAVAEQAALAISQAKLYQQIQQQAEKMRTELEVARQIQLNLLPQKWSEVENAKVQAICLPAREVGGDFFEVYVHPQGDIWLALGDVSGKGVPAALFMASALSILRRELARETSPEPEVVMRNLNQAMSDDLFSNNCFITMVIARYSPQTKQLVYANAGHVYPLVWSHQQLVTSAQKSDIEPNYLKTRGIPVGILPVWKAQAGNLQLNTGDVLLITSDGITEATVVSSLLQSQNPNSMLNQAGLWELITQESQPFDLNHLLQRFQEVTHKVQEDDQTIVSLEVL